MATSAVAARRALVVMRRILPNVVQGACIARIRYQGTLKAVH
jgi:hypothetical protein